MTEQGKALVERIAEQQYRLPCHPMPHVARQPLPETYAEIHAMALRRKRAATRAKEVE